MLWAAIAFAAGIAASPWVWRPAMLWGMGTAGFAMCSGYFAGRGTRYRSCVARALALLAVFFVGALNLQVRGPVYPPAVEMVPFADGEERIVTAHVMASGEIKEGGFGGLRQQLDVETEQITSAAQARTVEGGLRLNIYARGRREPGAGLEGPAMRPFQYGERLRFTAKLRPPRNFRNLGAFDYRGYLAQKGIAVLGSAKLESVEVLPGFAGSRIERWRNRARLSILGKIHELWPQQQAGLVDAMVAGEDAFIERDTRVDFQRSGTYHILVVSGMNLSILAAVVFWTLRRLRAGQAVAAGLTVLLSVGYAMMTGVGPPIWRATLMMTIYLMTRMLYRDGSMLNAVGLAGLGLLIVDPRALAGASFQLTFLAVLIIAAVALPLLERSVQPYARGMRHLDSHRYDLQLPPRVTQLRLDLRMIAGRLALFVGKGASLVLLGGGARMTFATCEVLVVSALMQVGLALPMAYYFHRVTALGLPANAVVIPLTSVLMPAAAAAIAVAYGVPALAKIPAAVAGACVSAITGTVHWLRPFSIADLRVPTPGIYVAAAVSLACILCMLLARRRALWAGGSLAVLTLVTVWLAAVPPRPDIRPGVMEVTAIDVGQGDATLVITAEGKTLLVDAGGPTGGQHTEFDTGEDVVSPYLWARGFSRLDAVAITHGHSDHMGGMGAIMANFHPRELWVGVIPSDSELFHLVEAAARRGVKVTRYFEGDQFGFGSTRVQVLSPPREQPEVAQASNNDSLVMRLSLGDSAVLLEGDAGGRGRGPSPRNSHAPTC